jgi:acyl carrier protein
MSRFASRAKREQNMNGKVSQDGRDVNEISHSPDSFTNETERRVAQVFADVLDLQWVALEDDIFTLGGDSFEAVRVALELERRFHIEFSVELLESAGRVRELAAWINAQNLPA